MSARTTSAASSQRLLPLYETNISESRRPRQSNFSIRPISGFRLHAGGRAVPAKIVNGMSEKEYPLPPATFDFLVLSLKTQTEVHLGLLYFGEEKDRPEPEFRMARHSIDLLAMLQEKTRGNTTMEEQRLIENALTELRFRFVQAMEQHQKKAAAAAQPAAPASEPAKTEEQATGAGQGGTEGQAGS